MIEAAKAFRTRVEAFRRAQFKAGDKLRTWHYIIGGILIVASAVVSWLVLQGAETDPSRSLTLAAGIFSTIVVALTAVQTTFRLGERAELHRSAANGFGKILDDLDLFIRRPYSDVDKAWDDLATIVATISGVEAGAPGYMTRTYRRAEKELEEELKDRRARAGRTSTP